MRVHKIIIFVISYLLVISISIQCGNSGQVPQENNAAESNNFLELTGPYLGQKPPGVVSEIFAPGIISYGFHEHNITFSDDAMEAFYVMSDNYYLHHFIIHLTSKNGRWNKPKVADFSGKYTDMSPLFSSDNNRLYFTSKRPYFGDKANGPEFNIWYSDRTEKGWTEAKIMPGPINTVNREGQMTAAANGNIYFQAMYEESWDIYIAVFKDGEYLNPEKLTDAINTGKTEAAPFISPDESYLLFHSDRDGGLGYNDLYISFRLSDNSWNTPVNLGQTVNSMFSEFNPMVSPDGKYLFYSSYNPNNPAGYDNLSYEELITLYKNPRNGYATLYWISADILNDLRPGKSD